MDACLATSRYIAFFDECGDHSLVKINLEFPVFMLSTVIVERDAYARKIIPALAEFKLRYFAHEGINLHSRDIRKSDGPFTILKNANTRNRFLSELTEMMACLPYTLFLTGIQKAKHKAQYGESARNPYEIALEFTFERILYFMEANGEVALPVVAEARGKNEDNELKATFLNLMTRGTRYNGADRFRKLLCPLSFRQKQDNIAGIQLADLCAHPGARHIMNPSENNRAYDVIVPHIYEAGKVNGFKVFPK